jgi:excisionase family DNA binding protein
MDAPCTRQLTIADISRRERPPPLPGAERDELMTAEEVAERLRMTRAWVYSETRLDRIPHLRLGRYFRYRRSAIERWIAELELVRAEGDDRVQ